jgi:uncharacterized protein YjbJ (UPF0337 family)
LKSGTLIAPQVVVMKSVHEQEEVKMGLPNRDEIEGKLDQAKGKTKEVVGRVVDDKDLEAEGNADRAGGKVQEGYGKARRKVGEADEDIGEAIKRRLTSHRLKTIHRLHRKIPCNLWISFYSVRMCSAPS